MKQFRRERTRSSWIFSIAVHVVVIALFATMTFRYPIAAFLGIGQETVRPEHIQFMVTRPPAGVGNGAQEKPVPRRAGQVPAPLIAPTFIPRGVPPVPSVPGSEGAVSGKAGGKGGAGIGLATGVEPAPMDPRLYAPPIFIPVPKTPAQRVDSAIQDAFNTYYDSAVYAAAHPQRDPRDWTKTDANGNKWGWDPSGIHLGKFMIPNAVLAALPIKVGSGTSPIEQRQANYIRQTVLDNAQRGVTENEFNDAVRRIRERKEREKKEQEQEKAKANKDKPIADGR